jgi:hypothetical protein
MTAIPSERKNTVVSEGVHNFKIKKSEEKEGKTSGEPYWNFVCECTDEGLDKGLTVWLMISLSPQARFRIDQFLNAINAPDTGSIDHPQCVGKTFRAEVEWDSYNGNISAKPTTLIPFGKEYTPKPKTQATQHSNGFVPQEADGTQPSLPATPGAVKAPF